MWTGSHLDQWVQWHQVWKPICWLYGNSDYPSLVPEAQCSKTVWIVHGASLVNGVDCSEPSLLKRLTDWMTGWKNGRLWQDMRVQDKEGRVRGVGQSSNTEWSPCDIDPVQTQQSQPTIAPLLPILSKGHPPRPYVVYKWQGGWNSFDECDGYFFSSSQSELWEGYKEGWIYTMHSCRAVSNPQVTKNCWTFTQLHCYCNSN
jgi:hypothetical protein